MKRYLTEAVNLLRQIKGRKILRMARLFSGDVNRFLTDFPSVSEKELFASSGYALFIFLEDLGWIAFSESVKDKSVVVWHLEDLPPLKIYSDTELKFINEQKYIECSDEIYSEPYWNNFLGKEISAIKIISLPIDRENIRPFRNERGLWIANERGDDLIVQTSLAVKGVPGGINVIKENQINPDLYDDLVFTDI